jgi:uncharacterized protein YqgC (DUF456 family)
VNSTSTDLIVGLVILVGIVGTIVPILPGAFLVGGAVVVWAALTGGATAWGIAIGALLIIALGQVLKYLVPGKQLKASGVPNWVLAVGGLVGIVGFFVVPVIGLILGFVLGVFLAEAYRLRTFKDAWPTTIQAMKSAGWSVLIEFGSAVFAAAVWAGGAIVT